MIKVRSLTDEERRDLQRKARHEVGRVSERMRLIRLSSRGYSVPEIAAIFEGEAATVRHWIARFEAEGAAGLYDRPRAGRPRQADVAAQEQLRQQVEQPPIARGYQAGDWTVRTRAAHLAQTCGRCWRPASVRRTLHTLGYRWRRPRHVLPEDPALAAKRGDVCAHVVRSAPEAVRLCRDEADGHLLPVLRARWMRLGQQVRIPTPGTTRQRAVFGALEWTSGRWFYQVREHKRTDDCLAFLEQGLLADPTPPLLLVVDNASIQHAKQVPTWLETHSRVRLRYLPADSGHREHPVEQVWWRLKDQIAANRLHGSVEALVAAIQAFFASFTPEDALRLTA